MNWILVAISLSLCNGMEGKWKLASLVLGFFHCVCVKVLANKEVE